MLVVKLLGQFSVQLHAQPIEIPSRPAQTLLAYLALQPGTAFRREKLAGLIWPDANESNARSNLRHALWRIRKALGDEDGQRYFPADDLTLAFNPEPGCWIDAVVLGNKTSPASPTLEEQVAAYQGELLPGFYDDWITIERERLQASFESKIETLIARLSGEKRWADVIEWAEHWIRFGAAPEPAYRALMLSHARSGHKAKVKETYQRCVEALQREYGVEPSEETQALYQELMATRPLTRPLASEPPAEPRHNLPTPATPLVGREAELAEITDRLVHDPHCRLLTIVGPGGIGKTRLALHAASQTLEQFADGTFFISFETITTAEAMAPAILQALSSAMQEQKDPRAQLIDYVRDKNLLLVLDNLEHLLEGTALIGEMLSAAPEIKIIVTSRERLHLQWEWLYEVQGLAYPAADAQNVERFSAIQLFLQTARRMRARFSLAEEQPHVIRICQLVEGLPLGLELAAAWVRVLSCREIAEQIERNLDVLSAQLSDVPDRHRSARAVFEYSWSLLAPEEQQVFMRLAIFPGGFRREAAEKVAGAPLSLLFTLVDKSLLRASAAGRYDMHTLLHQFVAEKAAQANQAAAIQTRLVNYYRDYARQHQRDYMALEEERLNLMTCLEMARNNWQAQVVLDYVDALGEMWSARGHWSDARKGYEWACDAAQAHDDNRKLAECLCLWGKACIEQGNYEQAESYLDQSLDLYGQLDDRHGMANVQFLLARLAITVKSDLSRAESLMEACLAVRHSSQDAQGIAEALFWQAMIQYYRSNYPWANQLAQQALDLQERSGDKRRSIPILLLLADIALHGLGDLSAALSRCSDAAAICESLHIDYELANAHYIMAEIYRRQVRFEEAYQAAQRSMELARSSGDRKMQAHIYYRLSEINHNRGNHRVALEEVQRSLALCHQLSDRWGTVYVLKHLGELYLKLGEARQAQTTWQQALQLAQEVQHPLCAELEQLLILHFPPV
jgi:predicted ATPase/DNA-binding SARP family transcriptional activator